MTQQLKNISMNIFVVTSLTLINNEMLTKRVCR